MRTLFIAQKMTTLMHKKDAKPKILMLHGYGQTAAKFKSESSSLRKVLGSRFEYIYIEAPHPVVNLRGENGYGWWTLDNDGILGTKTYNIDVEGMKKYDPVGARISPKVPPLILNQICSE